MRSTVRNVLLLLLASLVAIASAAPAETWGYHEDRPSQPGPSKWATVAPACGGKSQSPINVVYHSNSVVNLWGTTDVAPIKLSGSCKGFNLKQLVDVFKWELTDATGALYWLLGNSLTGNPRSHSESLTVMTVCAWYCPNYPN